MSKKLQQIGIRDESFQLLKVADLIKKKIIEKPMDGNHGEIHPKGEDFVDFGVPFVMASDISFGSVDYSSCKYISKKQADSLRKGFAKNGDVLVTHKATIGRVAVVDYDDFPYIMLTPQVTYYRIIDKGKLDNHYLKYYFKSSLFQQTLNMWSGSGSTRAYLGITAQHNLPVIVPPIDKQRKIAAILSAYDDLIENNKRRIAILEKMAEETYREWFVRFRFPGWQKAEFEKGIPKGWKAVSLGELSDITSSKRIFLSDYVERGVPFYRSKEVIERYNGLEPSSPLYISEDKFAQIDEKFGSPKENDILITSVGTLGIPCLVRKGDRFYFKDGNLIWFRSLNPTHNRFIFFWMQTPQGKGRLLETTIGSSQQAFTIAGLKKIDVLLPDEVTLKRFMEIWDSINEQKEMLIHMNGVLQRTKESLLPRLISGKLSVEDLDIQFPPSMQTAQAS